MKATTLVEQHHFLDFAKGVVCFVPQHDVAWQHWFDAFDGRVMLAEQIYLFELA